MAKVTTRTAATFDGGSTDHDEREHRGEAAPARSVRTIEQLLAVDDVGQHAADDRQEQERTELGEDDQADEDAGELRQVVGDGAEHDVLHPRADVGGERAEVDDAERPVRDRRHGRCRARIVRSPSSSASSASSAVASAPSNASSSVGGASLTVGERIESSRRSLDPRVNLAIIGVSASVELHVLAAERIGHRGVRDRPGMGVHTAAREPDRAPPPRPARATASSAR